MKYVLCLLVLVLFGCSASHPSALMINGGGMKENGKHLLWEKDSFPVTVYIPSELNAEDTLAVIHTINTWNTVVQRDLFEFSFWPGEEEIEGCGYVRFEIKELDNIEGVSPSWVAFHQGTYYTTTNERCWGSIVVDDDLKSRLVRVVLLHEFGHALGLAHDGDPHSIMYPTAREGTTFQYQDILWIQAMVDGDPPPYVRGIPAPSY